MNRWSPTRMVPSMEAVGTTEASPINTRTQKTIRAMTVSRPIDLRRNDLRRNDLRKNDLRQNARRQKERRARSTSAGAEAGAGAGAAAAASVGRSHNSRD